MPAPTARLRKRQAELSFLIAHLPGISEQQGGNEGAGAGAGARGTPVGVVPRRCFRYNERESGTPGARPASVRLRRVTRKPVPSL